MRIRVSTLVGAFAAIAMLFVAGAWWATRPPPAVRFDRAVVGVLARAGLAEPFGVAVTADGAVVVSDGSAHRIGRATAEGRVVTLAGSVRGFVDGPADQARFATPSAVAVAADGTMYVADTGNHAIRRVAPDGRVVTVAGTGAPGFVDGPGPRAALDGPIGVALDGRGRIVVADTYNDRIRVIETDGSVRTLAGGDQPGLVDGPGADARFDMPCGVAVDAAGRILVADSGNGVIRQIAPDGVVSTLATAGVGLERPMAVAVERDGAIVVADESGAVVRVGADGQATLLAGGRAGFANGEGEDARFRRPSGIAVSSAGGVDVAMPMVIVADAGNGLLRTLRPSDAPHRTSPPRHLLDWWKVPALDVPPSPMTPPAFDDAAFARVALPWPVAPMEGPHEVAGTFAEARGEAGQERFHAGLDVREAQGTPVRAVRAGTVLSPFSAGAFDTLNESLRIGDLAYIHIRAGRTAEAGRRRRAMSAIPVAPDATGIDLARFDPVFDQTGALVRIRARRGAVFPTGDIVGSINRFNHVHLNVGWPGEEHNPLRFRLVQFSDGIAPSIAAHGVRLFDEAGVPLNPDRPGPLRGRGRSRRPTVLPPLSPVVVQGRVRIVVDAWDQADGNAPYRRLGLYALGYEVHRAGAPGGVVAGSAVPTLVFDRMPREREAAKLVFASGSGIPVYGASRTQFLYVVTTRYRDGVVTPDWWDTTMLAPGSYVLRVFGEDFSGNRVTRDLDVIVAAQQ